MSMTLRYKGLNCFGETNEPSGSDEIYLYTIVTTLENGKSVVRTEKHPVDREMYDDVDKGASFGGPVAPCYFGPAQELSLTVIMMEADQGDPNAFKDKIDAAVKAAAAAASQGAKIPEIAQVLAASAINELLGTGDDNIGEVTRTFTAAQVVEESRKPPGQDQNVSFSFLTEHTGQGSTYRAFFDIVDDSPLPIPRPPHRAAFNEQDRFVLAMGNRILVTVRDGRVIAHDITGTTIGAPFQMAGAPVAFNPGDRFALVMGNRILVSVPDGRVFAHDVTGNTIGEGFQLGGGHRVAFNPEDRFVIVMGNRILVTVRDGRVFGHEIAGNSIVSSFQLS